MFSPNSCLLDVRSGRPEVYPTRKSSSDFYVFALSRYACASPNVFAVRHAHDVGNACDRSKGRVNESEGKAIRLIVLVFSGARVLRLQDIAMYFCKFCAYFY